MDLNTLNIQTKDEPVTFKSLFIRYVGVLSLSVIIASVLYATLWAENAALAHTVLELICAFIAIATFIVIWYVSHHSFVYDIIGFGFLTVAIFNIFHICFYADFKFCFEGYFGLSTKYWLLRNFSEVMILLIISFKLFYFKIDRRVGLIVSSTLAIGLSYFVLYFPQLFPALVTKKGPTPLMIFCESIFMVLFLICLCVLCKSINDRDILIYKDIFMALLIVIPAKISFSLQGEITSFWSILGHTFKVVYYYYLFKGIFVSVITYPYQKQSASNLHIPHLPDELSMQTQMIMNAIGSIVVITDSHKNIVMYNSAFEEAAEMTAKDVIGVKLESIVKKLQLTAKELPQPRKNGEIGHKSRYEISVITKKCNKKELLADCTLILNGEQKITGYIFVAKDITNVKQEQQKLIQQEKLALLGQMGTGIVHETKNFLTTIKGASQLLVLKAKDQQLIEYAQKIDKATNEVNRIISDFLSLAKPGAPVLHEISLNELVHSLKGMLVNSSFIRGVEVQVDLSLQEERVMGDEAQIKQVLLNISKNAIEAMAEIEKPLLKINTGFDQTANEMFINIADNGKGISNEDRAKIGTPFFTTKKNGTGLGLNLCFQIIREHGGSIDINSEKGKGSIFTILLPCKTKI